MPAPNRTAHVVAALAEHGGAAAASELCAVTSRGMVRAAERAGAIVRLRRGRYALPELIEPGPSWSTGARPWGRLGLEYTPQEAAALARARVVAVAHGAVLSHRSAAAQHDWAFFEPPARLEVVLPYGGHPLAAPGFDVRWRQLDDDEREAAVTSPMRTVLHCAADLPFGAALGVADSAVRSGRVDVTELRRQADLVRAPGGARVRRVARHVDPRAANPFESAMRAIALTVPGLCVEPQVVIADDAFYARVDLADRVHRIVIEGDSYEFHGGAQAFARDCARYDELVARGWSVLRFTVADVRDRPAWVRRTLVETLARRAGGSRAAEAEWAAQPPGLS